MHAKLRIGNTSRRETRPGFEATHPVTHQQPGAAGVKGAGGICRDAGGRWWCLAAVPVGGGGAWPGFETTRRAEGSRRGRLAGGPPPTGASSSPAHETGHAAPGTPAGRKQQPGKTKTADPERICGFIVREGGVEPPLHHWNTDLNRARLPIPPLARTQKE